MAHFENRLNMISVVDPLLLVCWYFLAAKWSIILAGSLKFFLQYCEAGFKIVLHIEQSLKFDFAASFTCKKWKRFQTNVRNLLGLRKTFFCSRLLYLLVDPNASPSMTLTSYLRHMVNLQRLFHNRPFFFPSL